MPIRLTRAERAAVRAGGGAAVLPLKNLASQGKATYFNEYGEQFVLPGDPWSIVHYSRRGLSLAPPTKPAKRDTATLVGVADWDGKKQAIPGQASAGPTATYYTEDGTAVPDLPADPESVKAYREAGLTLSRPRAAQPTPIGKRKKAS